MTIIMKADRSPNDEATLVNRLFVNDKEYDQKKRHVVVKAGPAANQQFLFTLDKSPLVQLGTLAFNNVQRKWASISLKQDLEVSPYTVDEQLCRIGSLTLEVDFVNKKNTTTEPYDTDKMAPEFCMQFPIQLISEGQVYIFKFGDKRILSCTATEIQVLNIKKDGACISKKANFGIITGNTNIFFEKAANSPLNLVGKSKSKQSVQAIINPDWDFSQMGIGGLDKEFSAIFRRAFASRVFPSETIQELGMKHCRGILLYGPPGTGKTLIARQIGKMLNAREPKIVNGPQILDKFVGESEANIRKLFAEAEEEEKRLGPNSGLHIIIFDEIDAICKARGSVSGSTAVHDTVVNQLLSKIDGVDQLNNILIIGMTNRKDLIDEALLRPGRLEAQLEISLPDEPGRLEIFKIHTKKMRDHNKLAHDVRLEELASLTKNFSGAEIEGLIRAATSIAMNRLIKATSKVEIDPDAPAKLQVTRADFLSALENDIKPAFGVQEEELKPYLSKGVIEWGEPVRQILDDAEVLIQQSEQLISVLLSGPPGSGKTALAVKIAQNSGFPFTKICTSENMIGYHEAAKVQAIKKIFDDAYKSQYSIVILDEIERLLDYGALGLKYSNMTLQAILVLLKKFPPSNRKLMIIGTTAKLDVLQNLDMLSSFSSNIHVPNIVDSSDLITVIQKLNVFSNDEISYIHRKVSNKRCFIGIKKLMGLLERSRQTDVSTRVSKFLSLLENEGGLEDMSF